MRPAWLVLLPALVCLTLAGCAGRAPAEGGDGRDLTELDRYVTAADPEFSYRLRRTESEDGLSVHVVELTSGRWLGKDEVDRPLWTHWLTLYVPEGAGRIGLLYLTGGKNHDPEPDTDRSTRRMLAARSGGVVAELRMIPNQPLRFVGDAAPGRTEDEIIALGWRRFLEGGRAEWLPRLPMTRAAVRAMDVVTEVMQQEHGLQVDRFVVSGRSKRGWTTWTTAAVDRRVVALAPLVIDVLNVEPSLRHHHRAYGGWAPAIGDYVAEGIPDWLGHPRMAELLRIVEPYSYRRRLGRPKLIVNAAGDEFFLPDSWRFYLDDLPGETLLRYVPNAGHALADTDAVDTLLAFHRTVLSGEPRPRFLWHFGPGGEIRVEGVSGLPAEATLWSVTNSEARDFRLSTIGKSWRGQPLEPEGGVFTARVASPERGWTAAFIELTYDVGGDVPLKLTTPVRVVPDSMPFPAP